MVTHAKVARQPLRGPVVPAACPSGGHPRRFTVSHGANGMALDLCGCRSCGPVHLLCTQGVCRTKYSAKVQQRPLTAASEHWHRHTERPAMTDRRPAPPLVRDEEAVPAACPMGGVLTGTHGRSRSDDRNLRRPRNHQVAAGQRHRLPKLIVRVRFPSPAPNLLSAAQTPCAPYSALPRETHDHGLRSRPAWRGQPASLTRCSFRVRPIADLGKARVKPGTVTGATRPPVARS